MSYIIALTGGIGSGKSTVSDKFKSLGIPIIDADIISRKIIISNTKIFNIIIQHFGLTILNNDGSLNRAKLRKKIFSEQKEKKWLNNLLHPLIHEETQRQLMLFNSPYLIWVIPLLIENRLDHLANRILVIDITRKEQISRIIKRDKINKLEVKNILFNQVKRIKRLKKADDIIDNNNIKLKLDNIILKLHKKYIQLSYEYFLKKNIK
ncbi:MAG: dephospho-CoA kinase [Arsenophonus endosymbiont of Ceratovacuna japonica]